MSLAEQISRPALQSGVRFDSNAVLLTGVYADQLSAYRARKVWIDTMLTMFLLERDSDFSLTITADETGEQFSLTCKFLTACARYAFWRLTNNQAPEAQYLIETAHIPLCESKQTEFIAAPDLAPMTEERLEDGIETSPLSRWLTRMLR